LPIFRLPITIIIAPHGIQVALPLQLSAKPGDLRLSVQTQHFLFDCLTFTHRGIALLLLMHIMHIPRFDSFYFRQYQPFSEFGPQSPPSGMVSMESERAAA
jgi:hypothetical protein